jgi:predicted SAM-dependent methyltransferase
MCSEDRGGAVSRSTFKQLVKRVVLNQAQTPVIAASVNLVGEIIIAMHSPISRLRLRALRAEGELKVHLGCGADVRPGWVNIDFGLIPWLGANSVRHHGVTVIRHDLRKGLPLRSGGCALIYSSHFLEHLEYRHGLNLIADCYRVLRPGGVFRAALPNFKGAFEAYLGGNSAYMDLIDICAVNPGLERDTTSLVDHINYGVYQNGEHKCIYDEEKMHLILCKAGFSSVSTTSYDPDIDPSDPIRRRYSFYVEARK